MSIIPRKWKCRPRLIQANKGRGAALNQSAFAAAVSFFLTGVESLLSDFELPLSEALELSVLPELSLSDSFFFGSVFFL